MKTPASLAVGRIGFWGICILVLGWLFATSLFEMHLGLPVTSSQWLKRVLGWGVELLLIRALILGVKRHYAP